MRCIFFEHCRGKRAEEKQCPHHYIVKENGEKKREKETFAIGKVFKGKGEE